MSIRFCFSIFLVSVCLFFTAGCGGSGEPTIIVPDDSVPSADEMEAFYNQAPEEQDLDEN